MGDVDANQSTSVSPMECILHLQQAINAHDLDAMTDCFEPDYASQFPAHPGRAFGGHAPMRRNWSQIFANVPDIHAALLKCSVDGDTVWSEWEWSGTKLDGTPHLMRGVTIQGVSQGRINWARLYIEPVETGDAGNDAAIKRITTGGSSQ